MGGEQTANREPGEAWATVWREVERPDRQWQGERQAGEVLMVPVVVVGSDEVVVIAVVVGSVEVNMVTVVDSVDVV